MDRKFIKDIRTSQEWYILNDDLCDKATEKCWSVSSGDFDGLTSPPYSNAALTALQILGLLLRFSDAKTVFTLPSYPVLEVASRLTFPMVAAPLDPRQWELEAKKIFNVTLARMQTDISNIAQGVGTEYQPHFDLLANAPQDPCGLIIVHAEGWKKISIVGLVGMLRLAAGLWILPIKVGGTMLLVRLYSNVCKPVVRGLVTGLHVLWLRCLSPLIVTLMTSLDRIQKAILLRSRL